MATFYIQLENRLLQISGELTAENISKALGYVPVDSSTMGNYATKDEVSDLVDMSMVEELSQRVDNITFDSLKDNPFLQDGSGELNIVDEAGNIIAKINADGIHSVDFIAGEHRLSDKTDKTYVDEALKNAEADLTGYVNNIDFYNIKNNPIIDGEENSLTLVDENSNIGLKVTEDGLYVKDVIAAGHILSQKADKSELSNYATKDEVSDLVDMSVVEELQGKVNTLVGEDSDKSVRTIANEELAAQLIPGNADKSLNELKEIAAWIQQHPEDASAMNKAIQANTSNITKLDSAYKEADTKVLTDANEYTDNINFYTIKDNPIVNGEAGSLTFVDETGYIGLKVTEDGIVVKDVVTPEHKLSDKANTSDVPTKVSQLQNDANYITTADIPSLDEYVTETELSEKGYLTEHQDISHLAEKSEIPSLDGYATEQWVEDKNYLTEHQDIAHLASKEELSNIDFYSLQNNPVVNTEEGKLLFVDESGNIGLQLEADNTLYVKDVISGGHILSNKQDKLVSGTNIKTINGESILGEGNIVVEVNASDLSDYVTKDELSNVAVSGSYNDLTNKPTIPTAVTESTVSGWGFTKNTGTYSKPSTGIPKTDLASAVQTSLNKADTALQSEQYKGTVTGVKINGTTKSPNSSGIVDLGTIEGGTGGGSSNGGGVAELMVEVTYDVLVEMRNNSELIPGMKYRMIDYETVLPANDTWHSVARHHFDLILTALDEKTLSERCSAIQSARDTEGYFANNNLGAWEIYYCLDNDTNRFGWAAGTRPAIRVDLSSIGMDTITVPYSGGFVDKQVYYCRWDAIIDGKNTSFLTMGDATGNIIEDSNTLYVLTPSYVDGSLAGVTIDEFGTVDDVTFSTDERGKGVIYRMIDEYQNDVYYDFKNVIVTKNHLFVGHYFYGGYTFSKPVSEEGNIIIDASNYGLCRNNLIKNSHGLLFNCIECHSRETYINDIQLGSNCFLCRLTGWSITIGDYCTNIIMVAVSHISIGNTCSNITIILDSNLSIVNSVSGTFDNPVEIGMTILKSPNAKKIAQNNNGQVVMFVEGEFTETEVLWPNVDEE